MANRSNLYPIPLFITLLIHLSYGLCISPLPQYDAVPLNVDQSNPAFGVFPFRYTLSIPETSYQDTFYRSEMLSQLQTDYNNCDIAVIATVTEAISFMPIIRELNQTVFSSESVTISIETVLKGQLKTTWNFVKQYSYPASKKVVDPQTGDTTVIGYALSHSEPRYNSIKNKRFLLFLKQTDITDNLTFPMPLNKSPCTFYLNQYLLNNYNEIYFDGFACDSTGKHVISLPEMTCPYDIFKASLRSSGVIFNPNTVVNRGSESQATFGTKTYNLLGKRIQNSYRSITSGAYIETDNKYYNALKSLHLYNRD